MRYLSRLLILTACVCVAASLSSAQPPKGKGDKGGKGDQGPTMSDAEMVDDIVNRMMAFDKNKDGKLTRDEITDTRLLRVFDKADVKKTGVVTKEDLIVLAKQMVADIASEGGGKGGGPGGKGAPGGPGGKGGGKGGPGGGGFGGPGGGGPGGPGGFGGGPPKVGQILPVFVQESLQLTVDQKKQLDALQSDVDAKLAKILTDDQRKQLKEMSGGPKKGPPPDKDR
jgi:Spy/CpxP family protein refolding chaperone